MRTLGYIEVVLIFLVRIFNFLDRLESLQLRLREFNSVRSWKQFHTARNLSSSISIEAAELLEIFQWSLGDEPLAEKMRSRIKEELADVFIYSLLLADEIDVDIVEVAEQKLLINQKNYPVEEARGNSTKYTERLM